MFSAFNDDPFSIFDNPMAKRLRENKIKLSESPKIKELKSFKHLDDSRVPRGYKLFKGVALATKWVGPVTNPWIDEINLEIFKLESTTDSFELVWEWSDGTPYRNPPRGAREGILIEQLQYPLDWPGYAVVREEYSS